jgi:NAD-dependent dihydropyrimidine dehydrogenase PreA subunit
MTLESSSMGLMGLMGRGLIDLPLSGDASRGRSMVYVASVCIDVCEALRVNGGHVQGVVRATGRGWRRANWLKLGTRCADADRDTSSLVLRSRCGWCVIPCPRSAGKVDLHES